MAVETVSAGKENSKPVRLSLRAYWDLLGGHLLAQQRRFFGLLALMLANIALLLVNPQIVRSFIDRALAGAAAPELVLPGLLFLGIALLQQGVSVLVRYHGEKLAWTATNALRGELAHHCLRLDMGFHNAHTPGELIERIDGDVTELAAFFSEFAVTLVGNLILLCGVLIVLAFEDWRVGLAFTFFSVLMLLVLTLTRDFALPAQKERREVSSQIFGFVEEALGSTEDVRANGAVGYVLRELHRLQGLYRKAELRASLRQWVPQSLMDLFVAAGLIITLLSGYLLYQSAALTIGSVYLLLRYFNLLETPIWALTYEMRTLQTIGACVQRLGELRSLQPLVLDRGQGGLPEGALELRFNGVGFAYDPAEPLLHDLEFHLPAGRRLGVLGRTGSGKSTLARLIFRLYDPQSGAISLNGAGLETLRLAELRRRVALVTQDVQLFRATLRDNLTFFDRSISDARILEALASVGLRDWVEGQEKGLDTLLAAGGRSLSAGEAQLLALARVFLHDPGLVILDEASSRLDPSTEARLEKALNLLLAGRTALIIAHRLGTVQRTDDILILSEGAVQEYGPRAALAADPGSRFAQLLQTGLEEVLA